MRALSYISIFALAAGAAYGQCTFTANPEAPFIDATSQNLVIQIAASDPSCAWTAASNGFATAAPPAGATGDGSVTYAISNNATGADRTVTLTVAGQTVTLTQRWTAQLFEDVLPDINYFNAANLMNSKDISIGCAGSGATLQYCGDENITRRQMAVFIVRTILGGGPGGSTFTYTPTPYFTDVPVTDVNFKYVQKLRDLGITSGCTATTYCPDEDVTRDQMAVFIVRARLSAAASYTFNPTPFFTDVPADYYNANFFKAIQKLKEIGITSGCTPTMYCPADDVTRGQMAIFIMRAGFNLLFPPTEPLLAAPVPASGTPGTTVTVALTGTNTNFASDTVVLAGSATVTAAAPVVTDATHLTVQLTIPLNAALVPVSLTAKTPSASEEATVPNGFQVLLPPPVITDFNPKSGPAGTPVTISGTGFSTVTAAPQIGMTQLGGGSIAAPVTAQSDTQLQFTVPAGAATGPITVAINNQSAGTSVPFTVNASATFTTSAAPSSLSLLAGQSAAYTVSVGSTNGFASAAALSLSGLPSGLTYSFQPASIGAGQTSLLTLTAPSNQAISTANLTITASAMVDGLAASSPATVQLAIAPITTSFVGRAVSSDALQTPLAGVVVTTLGLNGSGDTTTCTGHSVTSDGAGNFALTNLPSQCLGPQLFGFNGSGVTSPAGNYAGLNLVFTLNSGAVTASPVLIHLPRINSAETFSVQQNFATDQTYAFSTIPGLSIVVYAHTTFTEADGSQPNPFPLAAVQVTLDRLPDIMPPTTASIAAFIVAFQPASTTASQGVAVYYPNTTNIPVGTDMPLMTLNPTLGRMAPYGTGMVSADGTTIIPDIDPSSGTLQHRYGLVHFDWHAPAPPASAVNPAPCPCGSGSSGTTGGAPAAGDPVDLSSGVEVLSSTDLAVNGGLGSIAVQRIYRTLTTNDGPFGLGSQMQYGWLLDTGQPATVSAINLITPTGIRYPFAKQPDGTFRNTTLPWLQGAVMTASGKSVTLRYADGTVYGFQPLTGLQSDLSSITDRNGNALTFQVGLIGSSGRITQITDPVGRSINLTYDGNGHVTTATDPIGRQVTYTYNSSGTLASFTDAAGNTGTYQYDSQNRLVSETDPLGVVMFQNTYDANGRISQQVAPDGGVTGFAYTLENPLVAASPVLATTITDPLGHRMIYRFNTQQFVTDVTDALGQTRSFTRAAGTNLILQETGAAQCGVCGVPEAGTMTYTYDAAGNLLTGTDALGNTTAYTYEPVFNKITSITDALGNKATSLYDGNGNLTSVTDPNGNTSTFTYNSNGLLLLSTDALGNKTSITYDPSANPISITDALGNVGTTVFDSISRPVQSKDPNGRRSSVVYDALSRVVSARDGRGNTVQFAYDPVGNLLKQTDPRGNTVAFTYDSLDRVTVRTSQLGATENYQYDLDGNITQYTDRRGQVRKYQYDNLNRLVTASYQDGNTVTRAYDPYSRLIAVNDSASGQFGYRYDANGRVISETGPTGTINYTRDALERLATRQVSGQNPVNYSYDADGNMTGAAMTGLGVNLTWDARNLPATKTRTNGVTSTYAFDPLGRVLSLVHANTSGPLNTQNYTYDPSGSRTSANNDLSQPLTTQATAATVDNADDLLTRGSTTYTADANGNRLTETGPNGSYTYVWDSRNRLKSITDGSGNVTAMTYDMDRNLLRVDRTVGNATATQRFVVDGATNVVSLSDSAGVMSPVLTGRSLDSHFGSVDSAGNVNFGITDAVHSTVGVTNASGALSAKLQYEPYGQTTGSAPTAYPFAFGGRVPVTGNVMYFRNRFYDTAAGRFLSEDPLGAAGSGSNLYQYAGNSPVTLTDPTGGIFGVDDAVEIGVSVVAHAAAAAAKYEAYRLYLKTEIERENKHAIAMMRREQLERRISESFRATIAGCHSRPPTEAQNAAEERWRNYLASTPKEPDPYHKLEDLFLKDELYQNRVREANTFLTAESAQRRQEELLDDLTQAFNRSLFGYPTAAAVPDPTPELPDVVPVVGDLGGPVDEVL